MFNNFVCANVYLYIYVPVILLLARVTPATVVPATKVGTRKAENATRVTVEKDTVRTCARIIGDAVTEKWRTRVGCCRSDVGGAAGTWWYALGIPALRSLDEPCRVQCLEVMPATGRENRPCWIILIISTWTSVGLKRSCSLRIFHF